MPIDQYESLAHYEHYHKDPVFFRNPFKPLKKTLAAIAFRICYLLGASLPQDLKSLSTRKINWLSPCALTHVDVTQFRGNCLRKLSKAHLQAIGNRNVFATAPECMMHLSFDALKLIYSKQQSSFRKEQIERLTIGQRIALLSWAMKENQSKLEEQITANLNYGEGEIFNDYENLFSNHITCISNGRQVRQKILLSVNDVTRKKLYSAYGLRGWSSGIISFAELFPQMIIPVPCSEGNPALLEELLINDISRWNQFFAHQGIDRAVKSKLISQWIQLDPPKPVTEERLQTVFDYYQDSLPEAKLRPFFAQITNFDLHTTLLRNNR
ncbi:MAG: hypothetical protein KDK65_06730 [Chlamydiia bacterium]|nr:hypothetical protein [Chlamydiia bacterium]